MARGRFLMSLGVRRGCGAGWFVWAPAQRRIHVAPLVSLERAGPPKWSPLAYSGTPRSLGGGAVGSVEIGDRWP
jgi:hypothetical protein